jgi:hypothetical protein
MEKQHRVHRKRQPTGLICSCSSGANRLGRNNRNGIQFIDPHRLGVWRTAKHRKQSSLRPPMVETGSYSLGGAWRTAKQRKRTFVQPPTVKTGSC